MTLTPSFYRCALAALLVLLSTTQSARADTAEYVLPQIGQVGTEVIVFVKGNHLETAEEVLFYQPGISCTKIEQRTTLPHAQLGTPQEAKPGTAISLTFRIAKDARAGEYFLRIRTKKKLSEMLSFWVTPFPVVEEENPYLDVDGNRNDTFETAQKIPLNSTILGYQTGGQPNDIDRFKVTLHKGQRCTAQMLNARLGTYHYGGLTDMGLEVQSPSNKRIARNDDSPLLAQDPVLSFIAPEAGEYVITARQQMDYEAPLRHYALHVGEFLRPAVTYPLGGEAGKKIDLTVFFEDGSSEKYRPSLPDKVGQYEASLIPLDQLINFPTPIPFPNNVKVSDFSSVFQKDGHHSPEKAQVVDLPLPLALNGIIKTEGEADWYRIHAEKGKRYRVRAYSRTLGSRLDPYVWIRSAEGNPDPRVYEEDDSLWDGHDWEGHHYRHQVKERLDPVFMFEPEEDGEYLVGIADTRREFGEDYIYRLEFQPHRDNVFTYYTPYPSLREITRDVIAIHRGSSVTHPISIQNGFGSQYNGPMVLDPVGLPKGIEFDAPVFTKNDPIILATFSAPADAKFGSSLIELVPRALEKGIDLGGSFAQTSPSTARRGDYNMVFNKTRKLGLAILEEAPFDVRIEQPKIGLAKDAELNLKVILDRKDSFEDAVYLEMDWLPPGITKQPPLIIPEGETIGNYRLSATAQAKDGEYQVSITARENKGGDPRTGVGLHYIASPLITLKVENAYLSLTLNRAAIEQGKRGEISGSIEHLRPFPGNATANLLRLPTGVTLAGEPTISSKDREIVFPVDVAPDALTGQYKEISAEISINDGGQMIQQQSGDGVLRIDPARK